MDPQENLLKLIAFVLRSSAVLFDFLAVSYRKWATLLENHLRECDRIQGRGGGTND